MLSQEVIEKLSAIFVKRVNKVNTFTLKTIARQLKAIKNIKDLRPTEVNKLVNLLKYGGDYNKIEKQLAKMSNLNKRDIDKIFKNTAKKNQQFAKKFYEYRNKPFIPLEQNKALLQQVEAIADVTKNTYKNIGNTRAIGFTKKIGKRKIFVPLKEAYIEAIDEGLTAVMQGKTTMNDELRRIVKEFSSSGLKYVEFESGYHRRLDSQVAMNLKDGLALLMQEVNLTFGEEFDANGVEISVHYNPAPDHAEVQGRQFTNEEFYKFQNDIDCYSYDISKKDHKGKFFSHEHDGHDRRSIGQYNCYHNIFPIIVGVDTPVYTEEQLQKIIDDNLQGIEYNGKHYTRYEGDQLMRKYELEIRKAKEQQIMQVEIDDDEDEIFKTQKEIKKMTKKYRQLCGLMGYKMNYEMIKVDGFSFISTNQ